MRLLNALNGMLHDYIGSKRPEYAILSHTWGLDEVTFQDIQNISVKKLSAANDTSNNNDQSPEPKISLSTKSLPPIHHASVRKKAGYKKIQFAANQALKDGYKFVWIDTCCIDKTSSSELSEAINSMFQWYRQASICYAYVEDIQLHDFQTSRWFTRGWTLQELLAPSNIIFYGKTWARLGTKTELAGQISEASGIDEEALLYPDYLETKSIAQRMSWASERETTRLEDMAYCLLGIFGVNMPLLYGEGEHAFIRLQEEILKYSSDQSLFAWSIPSEPNKHGSGFGIFAQSPKNYRSASAILFFQQQSAIAPYMMTNKGVQLELPLISTELPGYSIGLLQCQYEEDLATYLGLLLAHTRMPDVFFRVDTREAERIRSPIVLPYPSIGGLIKVTHRQALAAATKRIYVERVFHEPPPERVAYQLENTTLAEQGFRVLATYPVSQPGKVSWNSRTQVLQMNVASSSQFVSFIFADAKAAFAVYVEEPAQNSLRNSPIEPRFHRTTGFAIQFTEIFSVSANLELAGDFGQTVRVLTVEFRVTKSFFEGVEELPPAIVDAGEIYSTLDLEFVQHVKPQPRAKTFPYRNLIGATAIPHLDEDESYPIIDVGEIYPMLHLGFAQHLQPPLKDVSFDQNSSGGSTVSSRDSGTDLRLRISAKSPPKVPILRLSQNAPGPTTTSALPSSIVHSFPVSPNGGQHVLPDTCQTSTPHSVSNTVENHSTLEVAVYYSTLQVVEKTSSL